MSKLSTGMFAATLFVGVAAFTTPGSAATNYPWCVDYGGGRNGIGAISCGFVSYAQCMETARGMGSMCIQNPAYQAPSERAVRHRHKKKKSQD
jgi:Protein of unknown function (DUF3551)